MSAATSEMVITIDPALFNAIYRPLYPNRSRYLHLFGGAASGKSYFAAQKIILRMLCERNHRFLLVRKVGRTVRNSMYALLKEVVESWGLSDLFIFRKTDLEIECPSTNSFCVYSGMDDPEKIKSIHGITGVWIEEATELSPAEFNQLDLRMRGRGRSSYFQIILTYNPIDSEHWIRRRFHTEKDPNSTILRTTYKDNLRFLDPEYVKTLKRLEKKDPVYYKIYALGEWASPEHVILSNWSVWTPEEAPSEILHRSYGIDFGFNAPSVLAEINWIAPEEIYTRQLFYERKLQTTDIIERLEVHGVDKSAYIYADNSRPEQIEEIYQAGYNIHPAKKGAGSVVAGIDYLKRYQIYVDAESEDAKKELRLYRWKLDKNGNPIDEPVKANDHFCDALRMGAYEYGREFLRGVDEALSDMIQRGRGDRQARKRGRDGINLSGY